MQNPLHPLPRLHILLLIVIALTLSACASPPRPTAPNAVGLAPLPQWSGRISVKVESDPVQQISASFNLVGTANTGELQLFTPVGSKAAELSWTPKNATLLASQGGRVYPDLPSAIYQLTGANIPMDSLFLWLAGKPSPQDASTGWSVDLSRYSDGKLFATRLQPLPRIELRIVLEQ